MSAEEAASSSSSSYTTSVSGVLNSLKERTASWNLGSGSWPSWTTSATSESEKKESQPGFMASMFGGIQGIEADVQSKATEIAKHPEIAKGGASSTDPGFLAAIPGAAAQIEEAKQEALEKLDEAQTKLKEAETAGKFLQGAIQPGGNRFYGFLLKMAICCEGPLKMLGVNTEMLDEARKAQQLEKEMETARSQVGL
jgi:hypothetical protein